MNVDQTDRHPHLATEAALIGEAIAAGLPVLGICLGGQLVARALGAEVTRSPEKEIGWYDLSPSEEARADPLLCHLGSTEKIFQWHGDTFAIPKDAVHLASSASCPNQAFRYGDRTYGLQFHLEVDQPMIERWLRVPENIDEIGGLNGATRAESIRIDTDLYIGETVRLAERVFTDFVRLFGIESRRPRPLRWR
jgi:GMP synthase (glutamine-hydrolysing)